MKQTTKRFYGTVLAVALVSGVTGAFALNFVNNHMASHRNEAVTVSNDWLRTSETAEPMQASNVSAVPQQHIDLTGAAEKACNSVVYIKVTIAGRVETREYYDPFEDFFGDFFGRGNGGRQRQQVQTPKSQASGSGVIISSDGYIVTNNHVVQNASDINITLNDNREFSARVIGLDETTDLALLKIDATDLPALVIGDSEALKVGEWVLAVGNPFNLTSTVTAGIVSAKARQLGATQNGIESFIQTDAAINAGNSGGALVNARGELVGINAMLYSQTGNFTGYGFAIPTTIMKKVVTDLKEYGTVQRALIGISGLDLNKYIDSEKQKNEKFDKDFGTNEGVYVAEVAEGGAAKEAGIEDGDVIVSVDGKKVSKMSELQEAITQYRPGEKVVIGVIRDKKTKSFGVTLRNNQGNTTVQKAAKLDILGAEFKPLTDDQKKTLNMTKGVQVVSISDGLLKNAGVQKDFIIMKINNQDIKDVNDVESALKAASQSEMNSLFIWGKYPSGKTGTYAIDLSEE